MRNQLAVAVANIEAFIDGKIEPTPARLHAVLQALSELDVLMNDLSRARNAADGATNLTSLTNTMTTTMKPIDVCRLILNEATFMEAAAQAKGCLLYTSGSRPARRRARCSATLRGSRPVSYTHLDVYKRQPILSTSFASTRISIT